MESKYQDKEEVTQWQAATALLRRYRRLTSSELWDKIEKLGLWSPQRGGLTPKATLSANIRKHCLSRGPLTPSQKPVIFDYDLNSREFYLIQNWEEIVKNETPDKLKGIYQLEEVITQRIDEGTTRSVLVELNRYGEYTRKEVHDIFDTDSTFTPQAGIWGLHGIVRIPNTEDYVFFISIGRKISGHEFDEYITKDGILYWQSQPSQKLNDPKIQEFIHHEEKRNSIYLFLRLKKGDKYTYIGKLKYHSHEETKEQPVYFQWKIIDWDYKNLPIHISNQLVERDVPGTREVMGSEIDDADFNLINTLLEDKPQLILYGPPGTGKTYIAREFAQKFVKFKTNIKLIQFHPSYSYEDFVEGISTRVVGGKVVYELKKKIFRILADKASKLLNEKFILIIDEINRGDISTIFGEMILGLEEEYRGVGINTSYLDEELIIPSNLYIIGTMNSADHSIKLLDKALRRRFNFLRMDSSKERLNVWLKNNVYDKELSDKVKNLYQMTIEKILEVKSNDKDSLIGHTYFFKKSQEEMEISWEYSIIPLVEDLCNFDEEIINEIRGYFKKVFFNE